jgi:WD40 repeat protein
MCSHRCLRSCCCCIRVREFPCRQMNPHNPTTSSPRTPIHALQMYRDLSVGTQLATFKACASPSGGVATVGPDCFVAAQTTKASLHTYAWHQEALLHRSFVAEGLSCVTADASGCLVGAGGASGTLYVWNVSSGRILATVKAHTKGVTCLRFNDLGCELFSGGQDCLVACWSMPVLVESATGSCSGQPRWTGCLSSSICLSCAQITGARTQAWARRH